MTFEASRRKVDIAQTRVNTVLKEPSDGSGLVVETGSGVDSSRRGVLDKMEEEYILPFARPFNASLIFPVSNPPLVI